MPVAGAPAEIKNLIAALDVLGLSQCYSPLPKIVRFYGRLPERWFHRNRMKKLILHPIKRISSGVDPDIISRV